MARPFAVFDIDGTLARSSLLQLTVRELVNRGIVSVGPGIEVDKLLDDWRQRVNDATYGAVMKKAVDIMFSDLPEGLRKRDYDSAVRDIVATELANIYVYTSELIKSLKAKGYFLVALSGGELRAVELFARSLDFDAWLGAVVYEESEEKLTGQIRTLPYKKDEILKTMVSKFDLDLNRSLAVGDTSNDISMLQMVKEAVVFNPNRELFKVARENGWMVVVERKDMVYGMTKDGETYNLTSTNV